MNELLTYFCSKGDYIACALIVVGLLVVPVWFAASIIEATSDRD